MLYQAKTLFATDFTQSNGLALQALAAINKQLQLDVYFCHVIASFWKDWLSSGQYEKEIAERLLTWQRKFNGKTDSTHIIIDKGHVARTVARIARDIEANLIVLGPGGEKSNHFMSTGAFIGNIARLAEQSVLVCQHTNIERILCGIDGSQQSAKALREAISLAKLFNAKLSIAAIIPPVGINPLGMEQAEISAVEENFKRKYIDEMNAFIKQFDTQDVKVDYHFPWGSPSHMLINMAEDLKKDLIVVGATGKGGIKELLLGSTADKILNHTSSSLLIVR